MKNYLSEVKKLLDNIIITGSEQYEYGQGVKKITSLLRECKAIRSTLYICGNGGSAGIAQHMTADFLKNGGLRTYNMYGQPTITCISNDLTYEYVFSKQLEMVCGEKDTLIAISSSGESENIVKALHTMKSQGGNTITFTGFKPQNRIRKMGDMNVYVPAEHYGMVESVHNMILQQLVDEIVDMDGVAMKI